MLDEEMDTAFVDAASRKHASGAVLVPAVRPCPAKYSMSEMEIVRKENKDVIKTEQCVGHSGKVAVAASAAFRRTSRGMTVSDHWSVRIWTAGIEQE